MYIKYGFENLKKVKYMFSSIYENFKIYFNFLCTLFNQI